MKNTLNGKIAYLSVISLAVAIVAPTTVLVGAQTALAYNNFGFDSEAQCMKITNLEQRGGFFDNSTYTKLVNMCQHKK
jgi:hypothetical protein